LVLLISASWIAKITEVSHQYSAFLRTLDAEDDDVFRMLEK
jgi:hypothetical protein